MADVLHKTLPDSELHEPKGVASAGQASVYKANGTGSGNWQKIDPTMLQGFSGTPLAGQPLVFDGMGGFTTASGEAYYYGTALTSPTGAQVNQLKVPLNPTNNFTQTISSNIALVDSQFIFTVGGLFHASFTISRYEAPETTDVIRTITAVMTGDVVVGALANDSRSSTTLNMLFRANASNTLELRKPGIGMSHLPGVLVQYAIHRIGA